MIWLTDQMCAQQMQDMRKMQGLMESCYAKTVMSGVMGFGLGGMFGAFMASVRSILSLSRPHPRLF